MGGMLNLIVTRDAVSEGAKRFVGDAMGVRTEFFEGNMCLALVAKQYCFVASLDGILADIDHHHVHAHAADYRVAFFVNQDLAHEASRNSIRVPDIQYRNLGGGGGVIGAPVTDGGVGAYGFDRLDLGFQGGDGEVAIHSDADHVEVGVREVLRGGRVGGMANNLRG